MEDGSRLCITINLNKRKEKSIDFKSALARDPYRACIPAILNRLRHWWLSSAAGHLRRVGNVHVVRLFRGWTCCLLACRNWWRWRRCYSWRRGSFRTRGFLFYPSDALLGIVVPADALLQNLLQSLIGRAAALFRRATGRLFRFASTVTRRRSLSAAGTRPRTTSSFVLVAVRLLAIAATITAITRTGTLTITGSRTATVTRTRAATATRARTLAAITRSRTFRTRSRSFASRW